jgi:tryptophan-rich sensory protein
MRRWISLPVFLALAFAAGFVGSRFLPGNWYAHLAKPPFNPQAWIFAPVWTVLYAMMAVAAWRAWGRGGFGPAIALWLVQLVFNAAWSWLFFGRHQIGVALVEILVMLALIVATSVAFWRRERLAGGLMLPYVAWVAFATVLNASLWMLNPVLS